jgi:adenosylmethionine-8-amino-7-oxononanoate aminotransferase
MHGRLAWCTWWSHAYDHALHRYNSIGRTKGIIKNMRAQGAYVRPLGNVLYLMATPTTSPAKCTELLHLLQSELLLL